MATPEDSSVLRQLIDQIDGELSTFNAVGSESDQSLATSQGSLANSEQASNSWSTSDHLEHSTHAPVIYHQHHQQQQHRTSVTSAIFGSSFDKPISGTNFGAASLVIMNTGYFAAPRAPQYIPSPLSSPISPGLSREPLSGKERESVQEGHRFRSTIPPTSSHNPLAPSTAKLLDEYTTASSQKEVTDPEQHRLQRFTETELEQGQSSYDDDIKVDVTELFESFGGNLKADHRNATVEHVDVFDVMDMKENERAQDGMSTEQPLRSSSLPTDSGMTLPELSFSSNDLTSLWTTSGSPSGRVPAINDTDKRMKSHTYYGTSEATMAAESTSVSAGRSTFPVTNSSSLNQHTTGFPTSTSSAETLSVRSPFPPKQSSPLKRGYTPSSDGLNQENEPFTETQQHISTESEQKLEPNMQPSELRDKETGFHSQTGEVDSARKRLSLVTSGAGLAAAAEAAAASRAQLESSAGHLAPGSDCKLARSFMDLPTWDLAPLSPPVEVKAISAVQSAAPSPMSARKELLGSQQQETVLPTVNHFSFNNTITSPASATLMTPTTPPTTREARILAGREALLRLSPDRNRVQRGPSASSTASSIASTVSSTAMHDITEEAAGIAEVAHQVIRPSSHASKHDEYSPVCLKTAGGIFGAIPQRGQSPYLPEHIPAENLVFPDKSLRPIPLKAYRVRKMTLKERNDAYTEAVQEFTRARTGLGVWALRSMMQHRPTTMQDPPVIVRAIAGKYGPGQAPTIQQHRQDTLSKGQLGAAKAATGEPLPGTVSSISGNVSGGIGTRIKNAGKRLSMDISGGSGSGFTTPDPRSQYQHPAHTPRPPSTAGSLFYKQKNAKSAVELGSWSSSSTRGLSSTSSATTTPVPEMSSPGPNHRNKNVPVVESLSREWSRGAVQGSGFADDLSIISTSGNRPRPSSDMKNDHGSSRSNSGGSSRMATSFAPGYHLLDDTVTTGGVPVYHDSTGGIGPITSSGFMERPMKRSLSNHSSRRPMSMMIIPNRDQSAGSRASGSVGRTGSAGALSSQSSSSLGSISSGSITSTSRTAHEHEGQQQEQKQRVLGVSNRNLAETEAKSLVYNEDGVLIPYADETTSKDEVYSPLTSPIMIPIGGFQGYSRVTGTGVGSGGRSSPQSAEGGGLTRPSTFASASSPLTTFSNPLSILSPTSPSSFSGTGPSPMPQRTIHPSLPTPEGGLVTIGSVKDRKEKATASQRHSTSSFSSLASFAKYQKRDSFVAGTTSKRMSKRERKKEEEQQRLDQRYSVSSASLNHQALLGSSSKSDYVTEQSLDKLSDVLPHVDRDRLSIYLQRSFGDEMVAISLAMADLRNGLL